jgi:cysteine desulfurase
MGVLTHGNVRITLPLQAIAPNLSSDIDRFIAELPAAVATIRAHLGASDL